jgi:TIR domain
MSRVFVSYAHRDLPNAERLYHDLGAAGHKPWLDRHSLKPGEDWRAGIAVLEYARQLLAATAHGFLEAYERGLRVRGHR